MVNRFAAIAGTAVGIALLVSGCEFSFKAGNVDQPDVMKSNSDPMVPKSQVEKITAQQWQAQIGGDPVSVSCPADLPMKLGATEDCIGTQGNVRYPIKIKVNHANPPNDAKWDWEVGQPMGPPA